jgi:hypothetical protein
MMVYPRNPTSNNNKTEEEAEEEEPQEEEAAGCHARARSSAWRA